MKDIENKNLIILILACITPTYSVFMGYTSGLPEYFGNIIGVFIILSIIVYVIEKIVPKKKEDEEDGSK